jgi:hypothetical protein
MRIIGNYLLLLLLVSTLFFSCKEKSILILNKEVSMQMPGRQLGTKSANYKIRFIPLAGSNELSFQKIMMDEKELGVSIYNLKSEKQTAFNANDTLVLYFNRTGNEIESSTITSTSFTIYYFEKNKLKKMKVSEFNLATYPTNQ